MPPQNRPVTYRTNTVRPAQTPRTMSSIRYAGASARLRNGCHGTRLCPSSFFVCHECFRPLFCPDREAWTQTMVVHRIRRVLSPVEYHRRSSRLGTIGLSQWTEIKPRCRLFQPYRSRRGEQTFRAGMVTLQYSATGPAEAIRVKYLSNSTPFITSRPFLQKSLRHRCRPPSLSTPSAATMPASTICTGFHSRDPEAPRFLSPAYRHYRLSSLLHHPCWRESCRVICAAINERTPFSATPARTAAMTSDAALRAIAAIHKDAYDAPTLFASRRRRAGEYAAASLPPDAFLAHAAHAARRFFTPESTDRSALITPIRVAVQHLLIDMENTRPPRQQRLSAAAKHELNSMTSPSFTAPRRCSRHRSPRRSSARVCAYSQPAVIPVFFFFMGFRCLRVVMRSGAKKSGRI